jgi:hypothetical protein
VAKPEFTGLSSDAVFVNKQRLRISVVDTLGTKLPGRIVVLTALPTDRTAGHKHTNTSSKPAGGFDVPQISTGSSGEATVWYTAPDVSGPIFIKGRSSGVGSVQVQVQIAVPDLSEYSSAIGALMVGDNPAHPRNHYATSDHTAALTELVRRYSAMFPDSAQLKINDTSLELGGLFDVDSAWTPPHQGHRRGRNTDIRTHEGCPVGQPNCSCHDRLPILSGDQMSAILSTWMILTNGTGSFIVHYPHGNACPHLHLAN